METDIHQKGLGPFMYRGSDTDEHHFVTFCHSDDVVPNASNDSLSNYFFVEDSETDDEGSKDGPYEVD